MMDNAPKQSESPKRIAKDEMVVVNIGKKQKRKRVRQLRKGRGNLFDKVSTLIHDLREEGVVAADSQPVVIVVREKSRGLKGMFG